MNVSQYEILHATNRTRSGSHIPPLALSVRAPDARSMGTRRIILAGSARARKMGTMR